MSSKKDDNFGKVILYGVLIVILLILWGISSLVSYFSGSDDHDTTQTHKTTQKPKKVSKTITKSDAEQFCEDAGLLGKYVNLDTVSIVTLDYNPYFEKHAGVYDAGGNQQSMLSWDGKNNDTDEKVRFTCYISGKDVNHITLQSLSVNNTNVVTSPIYDKSGKVIK